MSDIQAIDKESIHHICSGQVIVDLSIAAKELVENSLDAGATSIEVKLKENGLDQIEVVDNGYGVEERNFTALTLKHYTSKLKDFSDLQSVATFGFRGEALSSLCALSDVTICTRHSNSSVGHKLEFNHDGLITSQSAVARQQGTTVTLKNLFKTLPVRYKELKKNIKREYGKLLNLITAYSIVSTDVKITCTNQNANSPLITILSAQARRSVRQSITAVYGAKLSQSLLEFQQTSPSEDVCVEFKINPSDKVAQSYSIKGFISDPIHGSGRSVPDRQFYFANNRPVEMTRLSRLVNEVYHLYNRHQYPFVVFNVCLSRDRIDVNVTPDKRHIFVHDEKVLLAVIKSSLIVMFNGRSPVTAQQSMLRNIDTFNHNKTFPSLDAPVTPNNRILPDKNILQPIKVTNKESKTNFLSFDKFRNSQTQPRTPVLTTKKRSCPSIPSNCHDNTASKQPRLSLSPVVKDTDRLLDELSSKTRSSDVSRSLREASNNPPTCDDFEIDSPRKQQLTDVEVAYFSMNRVRSWSLSTKGLSNNKQISSFRARIDPNQNSVAQEELDRLLSRDSFTQMKVVGQFNLGFIITQLGDDLFIIDQHASDEIFNFESLKSNADIPSFKLIIPHRLNLDPAATLTLIDDVAIFKKNGFDFDIRVNKESGLQEVFMTKVPISKNWEFGSSDVDEMLFMLSDAPHTMCTPSRIRQMFASRACRKSVMIGSALTRGEMSRLIKHMSEISQPWNCPHGRPTMRHLIDLSKIS